MKTLKKKVLHYIRRGNGVLLYFIEKILKKVHIAFTAALRNSFHTEVHNTIDIINKIVTIKIYERKNKKCIYRLQRHHSA